MSLSWEQFSALPSEEMHKRFEEAISTPGANGVSIAEYAAGCSKACCHRGLGSGDWQDLRQEALLSLYLMAGEVQKPYGWLKTWFRRHASRRNSADRARALEVPLLGIEPASDPSPSESRLPIANGLTRQFSATQLECVDSLLNGSGDSNRSSAWQRQYKHRTLATLRKMVQKIEPEEAAKLQGLSGSARRRLEKLWISVRDSSEIAIGPHLSKD